MPRRASTELDNFADILLESVPRRPYLGEYEYNSAAARQVQRIVNQWFKSRNRSTQISFGTCRNYLIKGTAPDYILAILFETCTK
ncbi:MAG TPA: hypothetical protein DCQ51_13390 [Planktothrix sp. UBA8407]|jgi:hypothetical protein|nr:hypothetical protein [Planktothrix sp. UBA8407]